MNTVAQHEPDTKQFLYEAVRPRGNRDEAGRLGEAIHVLADTLCKQGADGLIPKSMTSAEVWCELDAFLRNCPQRQVLVKGHFRALRALRRQTGRV